jgi:hypothetical protein
VTFQNEKLACQGYRKQERNDTHIKGSTQEKQTPAGKRSRGKREEKSIKKLTIKLSRTEGCERPDNEGQQVSSSLSNTKKMVLLP